MLATYNPKHPAETGLPTERLINLYQKFGNGGYGVLLSGNVMVHPVSLSFCPNTTFWLLIPLLQTHLEAPGNVIVAKENESEKRRKLLQRYAAAAKSDGALAIAQLSHAGRQTAVTVNPRPYSASDVQLTKVMRGDSFGKPVPLTLEQIKTEVIDRFVYTAKAVREAGMSGRVGSKRPKQL